MNSEVKGILVSVFALAIAAGMGTYTTTSIQANNEKIEQQKFEAEDVFITLQNNKEELNKLINFPALAKYDDSLLITANNLQGQEIYKLQHDLNSTREELQAIANKMLVVEALQNKVTQAKPQGHEMFSLQLLKSDGNYVTNGEFKQSDTVYITGKYDGGTTTKFDVRIHKSGQMVLERNGLNMPTDGIFSYYFNLEHNALLGQYTVTVTINGKLDTISFEII